MRLSVFYDHVLEAAEQSGWSVEEELKRVKSFGIDALECNYYSLTDDRERVKASFERAGISVAGIYRTFDFGRKPDDESYRELIELGRFYNTESILIIPGFAEVKGEPTDFVKLTGTPEMENMALALKKIVAEAGGIDVIMEDFDDVAAPFASDVQLKWFAEHVPGLHICFDTGNFCYAGVDELKAYEMLRGNISHVHLKDRALSGVLGEQPKTTVTGKAMFSTPVGSGFIHIKEIVEKLLADGYDGTLALEHFGAYDQDAFMEKSADYVRGLL